MSVLARLSSHYLVNFCFAAYSCDSAHNDQRVDDWVPQLLLLEGRCFFCEGSRVQGASSKTSISHQRSLFFFDLALCEQAFSFLLFLRREGQDRLRCSLPRCLLYLAPLGASFWFSSGLVIYTSLNLLLRTEESLWILD